MSFGQTTLDQAKVFEQSYQYDKAAQSFLKLYQQDTTNRTYYFQAGKNYLLSGNNAHAKSILLQLEQDSMQSEPLFSSLGNIFETEQHLPKAIKYYSKCHKLNPNNAFYCKKLASLYSKARLPIDAFHYLSKAHKNNPKDIQTMVQLGDFFLQNNQINEADSIVAQCILLDSTNISSLLLKARLDYKNKAYDSVYQTLVKTSGQIDLNDHYLKMLGYSCYKIDSLDQAILYLRKSLNNDSNPEVTHFYMALVYEIKEMYSEADFHFDKAIEHSTSENIASYYVRQGKMHQKNNRFKKAMNAFDSAYFFNQDPNMIYYHATCADLYYKDKNIAISWYNKFLKAQPEHQAYTDYSKKRMTYLKEFNHQKEK